MYSLPKARRITLYLYIHFLLLLSKSCSKDLPSLNDKKERQTAQKDNERRIPGKVQDAIISLKDYDLPFGLVEVIGPPNQEKHRHFAGDRVKLAKQLKSSLKRIRKTIESGDEGLYEKLKLYGIQIYLNKIYVYSLRQPIRGIYVLQSVFFVRLGIPWKASIKFLTKTFEKLMESKGNDWEQRVVG